MDRETPKNAGPAQDLTLSDLCGKLQLSPRQVQYLRESGVVVPSIVGTGRGSACFYSTADAVDVYTALVCLPFTDNETKKKILHDIHRGGASRVTPYTEITVEWDSVCREVYALLGLTQNEKSST